MPVLAVAGGDGSCQLAAQELQGTNTALGLIPAGRGNDLARALGISTDPELAVRGLLQGEPRSIDLGRADDRVFVTVAACGFDAQVSELVHRGKVPGGGTGAYVLATLLALARLRPARVCLEGDFGRIDEPMLMAATANTSCYGGGMRIAPRAEPDDGLFDVCVVGKVGRLELVGMLGRVFEGRHLTHPAVRILHTRRLRIETSKPWLLHADGEPLGRTPTQLELLPAALKVMVPRG